MLIVGNNFEKRPHFQKDVLSTFNKNEIPYKIVGYGEEAYLSKSWKELRNIYSNLRCYLNLTRWPEEDGFNLSMIEAMATGMPVISFNNPTTPLINMENGIIVEGKEDLILSVKKLFNDYQLSQTLGEKGKKTIEEEFNFNYFVSDWNKLFLSFY